MKTVVIGGNGLIGSKLVQALRANGHSSLAASTDTGVDTLTGRGLLEALRGAEVVVDVCNADWDDDTVVQFLKTATRNLLAADAAAGVRHHVVMSVVGTDRFPESAYFRAKTIQEELVEDSPVPYSVVRATQFFEFIHVIADAATGGNTVRLPPALIRPMAADDVASALVRVAVGPPLNGIVEIAGPEEYRLDEVIRVLLTMRSDPREVVSDPRAHYWGISPSDRALLPGADARLGETRFADWLRNETPQAPRPDDPAVARVSLA